MSPSSVVALCGGFGMASDATILVTGLTEGDAAAADALLPLVYRDLHAAAEALLRGERSGHTLQPTALVHEAYLRLVDQSRVNWAGRTHFCAVAAEAMRRVLVDHARGRGRLKRGGDRERVPLDPGALGTPDGVDTLELDDSIRALQAVNERAARVVVMRYFGGLSTAEAAAALGVSDATVEREWRFARAWLFDRLSGGRGKDRHGPG